MYSRSCSGVTGVLQCSSDGMMLVMEQHMCLTLSAGLVCRNYYWTLGGAGVSGVFVANEELFTVNVDKVCSMPGICIFGRFRLVTSVTDGAGSCAWTCK